MWVWSQDNQWHMLDARAMFLHTNPEKPPLMCNAKTGKSDKRRPVLELADAQRSDACETCLNYSDLKALR